MINIDTFKYCVYLTKYTGNLLPKYYIGSTNINKALSGKYFGSIVSKKWKYIYKNELKNNINSFSIEILSKHKTREEALTEELRLQILKNVVKSDEYFNESLASINGMFGRDVKGKNNPMYGKIRPDIKEKMTGENNPSKQQYVKDKISKSRLGKTSWNKGLSMTQETKDKLSLSKKNQIPWNKGKKQIKDKIKKIKWNKGKSKYQDCMDNILNYLNNNTYLESNQYKILFSNYTLFEINKSIQRLRINYNIINLNISGTYSKLQLIK